MENIIFKGRRDRISILFNDKNKNFEQIKNDLEKKIEQTQNFFDVKNMDDIDKKNKNSKRTVEFLGYDFSQTQKSKLLDILIKKTGLDLSLFLEKQKSDTELKTLFYRHSLRSGQFINYVGNVIVLGDVNPGAEIISTGSIIVMGTIRGLTHAGCAGDKTSIISALSFISVQVRISDLITCVPDDIPVLKPSYVFIDNKKLCVSPL